MGYKISNLIIGLIIVSMLVSIFTVGITDLASRNNLDFDNASLERYDKTQAAEQLVNDVRNNESLSEQGSSLFDIIGELFNKGLKTIKATRSSFDTIETLANSAGEDLNIGTIGRIIATGVGSILFIIFIIGILITTLTKREQ